MGRRKTNRELRIVVDTNVIFASTAHYLLNQKTSEFIKEKKNFSDISLSWYIPEVVVKERTFQMINKGKENLPAIKNIEKILNHNLHITEAIIEQRVKENIQEQIEEHGLKTIVVDTNNVDWNTLIHNSVFRLPPFEEGQKEKGFKDSIILEALDQLIKKSPKTTNSCMIIFMSNDNRLIEAAKIRTKNVNNIRFFADLEQISDLINTLISEIKESLVAKLSSIASGLFFIKNDKDTLYYKENISKQILDKYGSKLCELPNNEATKTKDGTWWISPVYFVTKQKQRIFWKSSIKIDLISYKNEYKPTTFYASSNPSTELGIFKKHDNLGFSITGRSDIGTGISFEKFENQHLSGLSVRPTIQIANNQFENQHLSGLSVKPTIQFFNNQQEEVEYLKGKANFEISWSVTYTIKGKLSNPKIEEITFIKTIWDDND